MADIPATLRTELEKLNTEQVLLLLGKILQPTLRGPLSHIPDEFFDALWKVEQAFNAAYKQLEFVATGEVR